MFGNKSFSGCQQLVRTEIFPFEKFLDIGLVILVADLMPDHIEHTMDFCKVTVLIFDLFFLERKV